MARTLEMADLMTSDGLQEMARKKLNGNFRRMAAYVQQLSQTTAEGTLDDAVRQTEEWVEETVVPSVVRDVLAEVYEAMWPVGCVIVSESASDARCSLVGKWSQVGSGKYVRFADAEHLPSKDGGAAGHSHGAETVKAKADEDGEDVVSSLAEAEAEPEWHALYFFKRVS